MTMLVHVMAPPDEGPIEDDARFCDEPDDGQLVVYGIWRCPACGEDSSRSDAVYVQRILSDENPPTTGNA